MFRKEGKRVSEAYDLPDPTHAPLKGPVPELLEKMAAAGSSPKD